MSKGGRKMYSCVKGEIDEKHIKIYEGENVISCKNNGGEIWERRMYSKNILYIARRCIIYYTEIHLTKPILKNLKNSILYRAKSHKVMDNSILGDKCFCH